YLWLLSLFVRNSLQAALEYRANFVVSAFQSTFWLCIGILSTLVFFRFSGTIGGWGFEQVLLVIGLFRIFEGVVDGVLRPYITLIVEHIQRGTLDFILLKPVDSQFMASLREFNLMTLPDFAVGLALMVYGLAALGRVPTPLELATFGLLLLCAVVMVYG